VAGNPRIEELRKKLDKEPGSRLFAQLAEELRKDGDLEDAIQVAREGLQKHSNYPSARMTLGRALFDTGDWAAARAEFELVLKGAPDNILASRLLAECLESLGDVPGAVARYEKTLALAPGDKQVLARLEALESGGGAAPAAARGAAPAVVAARGPVPDATLAPPPPPIRVVEVDTPMELEQAHERATSFSAASAPAVSSGPPGGAPAPAAPAPPPIPVSAVEEDFELERPYEAPRPAVSAPAAPPAPEPPAPPPPPRQAESMMEFEFEAGPIGSTIPFAPPPAPAPPTPEVVPPPPVMAAPAPEPPPVPPPVIPPPLAAAPPPPPVAPAPPPAAFVPAPEPPAAAAKTVEVPWSAPPPPRVVPPPPPPAPAPPARAPQPAPAPQPAAAPLPSAARPPEPAPAPAPAPAAAPEPASGELTSPTLAELYFKQGFPEKAIEVYRQLVDREPGNDRLRRRLAELQGEPPAPASRRAALERTIARLEGMLAAIKKG